MKCARSVCERDFAGVEWSGVKPGRRSAFAAYAIRLSRRISYYAKRYGSVRFTLPCQCVAHGLLGILPDILYWMRVGNFVEEVLDSRIDM